MLIHFCVLILKAYLNEHYYCLSKRFHIEGILFMDISHTAQERLVRKYGSAFMRLLRKSTEDKRFAATISCDLLAYHCYQSTSNRLLVEIWDIDHLVDCY